MRHFILDQNQSKIYQMQKIVSVILGFVVLASCARPIADFGLNQRGMTAPVMVEFDSKSKKAKSYHWDFGDGTTSENNNPIHKFYLSGSYDILLTAKNKGRKQIIKKTIHVKAPEKCLVEIETSLGSMIIELYDETPLHRDNFIKLAEKSFYDSLLFHRVINGFMIQGGDPESKNAGPNAVLGGGGPGYQIPAEIEPHLHHVKGALAAARTGDNVNPEQKSSGSQFYIVHGSPVNNEMIEHFEVQNDIEYSSEEREMYANKGGSPQLDGKYTVFGRVIRGLDVIDKIVFQAKDPRDRPEENIWMVIRVIK